MGFKFLNITINIRFLCGWPDSTSGNTFASGAGGIAQVVIRSLLVREVWGSNSEPIKSPTRCQRFATVATFIVWALAQRRGDGHHSLVTPERVLSEYNEDLICFDLIFVLSAVPMNFFGLNVYIILKCFVYLTHLQGGIIDYFLMWRYWLGNSQLVRPQEFHENKLLLNNCFP